MDDELTQEQKQLRNDIYFYLKGNPRYAKSKELQARFKISGAKVRECIHDIRVKGCPIISDANGYKFAQQAGEIEACIASLFSRVRSIAEAARGLVRSRDKHFTQQQSIEFEIIDDITRKIILLNDDELFKH